MCFEIKHERWGEVYVNMCRWKCASYHAQKDDMCLCRWTCATYQAHRVHSSYCPGQVLYLWRNLNWMQVGEHLSMYTSEIWRMDTPFFMVSKCKTPRKKSLIVAFFGGEVKVSTFTTPGRLRKWTLAKKTYEKRTCTLVFHTPCEDRCFCPQTPPEKACKGVLSHTSKRVRYFLGRDGLMEDGSGGQIESETILLAEDLEPVSESFVWGNNFLPTFQPFRRPSAHCQHAYLGNIYRSMNGLNLW